MDFNDIQNMWNNDKADDVALPDNLEKIKAANTPLDKIRKNLKSEFIYQIISIFIIGLAPLVYNFSDKSIVPFYLLYSMFTAVCVYFLIRLFIFYKRLNNITLKTKDSLYETYFDIRLNMELYKTFGFALTPFLVLFLLGLAYFRVPNLDITELSTRMLLGLVLLAAFSILLMGLMLEWWVHYFYGKYAKEIRKVLDELKED
ncbi:hypothetical protein [Flavobacterium ardleyense]|uniref:hypothetical protein n=1 Tax=Flavobacterium ardleyense TaxID=2038737 RepID=UPI00298C2B60|nr:hypothetical protein [Flavobacterium ardleyense]